MLKINSKQARENIRNYIIENFDASNYTETPPQTWPEIARFILITFEKEKYYSIEYMRAARMTYQDVFVDWCAGLPSVLHTSYYYLYSAVDVLGGLLEQTEKEKSKYSEAAAEMLLSKLIYQELLRGAK